MFRSSLVFKSFIEDNPISFAMGGLILSLLYFTTLLYYIERPYYNYIDSQSAMTFLTAWSFILNTISTIGGTSTEIFGILSKFLIFFTVIFGALFNAIFLQIIYYYMKLSTREIKAVRLIKKF